MELISKKMDLTFSLRRKEIVKLEPMVLEIQERWPALFLEEQICEEFCRVTTKDLLGNFRAASDRYAPRLLKLYRARKGAFSQDMDNLLEKLDEQTSNIELHRRRTSLEGLSMFVHENSRKLSLTCLVTDPEDRQTKGVKMGILTVLNDVLTAHSSQYCHCVGRGHCPHRSSRPPYCVCLPFRPPLCLEHGVPKRAQVHF
ncbi:hypothetical protein MHYP_G00349340 [Metynnis hypsauchen]